MAKATQSLLCGTHACSCVQEQSPAFGNSLFAGQAGAGVFLVRGKEVIDSTSVQLFYIFNSLNVTNIFSVFNTPPLSTQDLLCSAFQTLRRGCDSFQPSHPGVRQKSCLRVLQRKFPELPPLPFPSNSGSHCCAVVNFLVLLNFNKEMNGMDFGTCTRTINKQRI